MKRRIGTSRPRDNTSGLPMLLNVSALLATLALVAAQAPAQTPPPPPAAAKPTGSISGRILEHETRAPVRGATVVAMRFGGSALSAVSDEDGRYRLEPAVAGMYLLRVEHERFVAMPTAGVAVGPATTMVEVAEGAQVRDMNLVMARVAVIRGRIVDEAGAPLARTFVDADGVDTRLASLINTRTDDRGDFELRVHPGRFFIRASDGTRVIHETGVGPPVVGDSEYVATSLSRRFTERGGHGHRCQRRRCGAERQYLLAAAGVEQDSAAA